MELADTQISQNAISGAFDYPTMRVKIMIGRKPIHILIDTRSTHNFSDVRVTVNARIFYKEIFD